MNSIFVSAQNNTNFYVRANFNSNNYEVIQINVFKWLGQSWKSDIEIENVINTHTFQLAILSSYFDFDDYDNPVHYYLQDMNIIPLISTLSFKSQFSVRLNKADISDSLWLGGQGSNNQIEFYSIDRTQNFYAPFDFDKSYIQIYIVLDQQIEQYKRTVYSFLDMFGFVGGIYELFKIVGEIFSSFFVGRIFYSSILEKLESTCSNNLKI